MFTISEKAVADDFVGYFEYDNSRAKDILGLSFRSLKDMIKDTIPTLQAIGT